MEEIIIRTEAIVNQRLHVVHVERMMNGSADGETLPSCENLLYVVESEEKCRGEFIERYTLPKIERIADDPVSLARVITSPLPQNSINFIETNHESVVIHQTLRETIIKRKQPYGERWKAITKIQEAKTKRRRRRRRRRKEKQACFSLTGRVRQSSEE